MTLPIQVVQVAVIRQLSRLADLGSVFDLRPNELIQALLQVWHQSASAALSITPASTRSASATAASGSMPSASARLRT